MDKNRALHCLSCSHAGHPSLKTDVGPNIESSAEKTASPHFK